MNAPLIDGFKRVHDSLRISVTDRCNIRCFYCMPEEGVQFMDRSEILIVNLKSGGAFSEEAAGFLAKVSNPTVEKPFKTTALRQLVRSQMA